MHLQQILQLVYPDRLRMTNVGHVSVNGKIFKIKRNTIVSLHTIVFLNPNIQHHAGGSTYIFFQYFNMDFSILWLTKFAIPQNTKKIIYFKLLFLKYSIDLKLIFCLNSINDTNLKRSIVKIPAFNLYTNIMRTNSSPNVT